MSRKIFYYSRTGNCATVAHTYSKNGEGLLVQIKDKPEDRYWGVFGYIKGGFHTVTKKEVSYDLVGDKYNDASEVILVTPVWAGQIPPTFRAFLTQQDFNPEVKVTVVTISNSGKGRETFHQAVNILQDKGVQEIHHRNLKTVEVK